ncbi:MerR family transcriptional regulator [Nocardia sp. 2]|uniref:MerR family transcriptional regulator n=1 Tax=Nocardia acididurans TaxID=2802282 RepID=A0ABS1M955_9NOCA|nr:MerR family transcriptional regulator [Nocardia acididurans]MBL1077099.1 MerR family transcriptional regulator [Nocardia acididurans]
MAENGLSVEELAGRVGVPTSTVRMYQSRGLLHAPRRVGRAVRYDDSHLERLQLVQRLQERGFSLTSIAALLTARAQGASVADLLALPGGPEDWVPLGLSDIRKIIKARDMRPALLRKATRAGLIRWQRGRPQTRRWALSSGLRVTEYGISPGDVLDQFARLRGHTDAISEDFAEAFERTLWPRIQQGANDSDQLEQVRALLEELTGIAEGVVIGALRESMRELAERFAERHALLPEDGSTPAWMDHPAPVLAERLRGDDSTEGEDAVEVFLAEDTEERT